MLVFPDQYFQDEVRDGFYVSGMMKCAWAAELKVLDAIAQFCKKRGLVYFADFGTLLGAVRHGGFIPWDDDIDITMPRADYMELIAHFDEMPEPYQLLSIYNSDTFYNFHAVVTNNNQMDKLAWDEKRLEGFYGCPYIVGIDIFPLDYLPKDLERYRLQQLLYMIAYNLVYQCIGIEEKEKKGIAVSNEERLKFEDGLNRLREHLPQLFGKKIMLDAGRPMRNALCRIADKIAMSCREEEAQEVDYYAHMAYLEKPIPRDKEWYKASILLPFETTQISAPVGYTAVLEKRFGTKYIEMVRGEAAHDYPFFKKQEEYFKFQGYL